MFPFRRGARGVMGKSGDNEARPTASVLSEWRFGGVCVVGAAQRVAACKAWKAAMNSF